MRKTSSFELGGKTITVETGKLAKQANGAVVISCGGTTILVTAVAADKPRPGMDFFPLTIDVEERMYAAGKIPGSFFRREGRPGEKAILQSRLIDRPLRPMFPDGFRNDVHVVSTILSVDKVNPPDVLSIFGASCALSITDIPFDGPVGGVRVGRVNQQFIVNPTFQELEESDMDLVMSGKDSSIVMVEAGSSEVSEADILEAFKVGIAALDEQVAFQIRFRDELWAAMAAAGEPRKIREFHIDKIDTALVDAVDQIAAERFRAAVRIPGKEERNTTIKDIKSDVRAQLADRFPDQDDLIGKVLKSAEKKAMRSMVLDEGKRADGRTLTEVRPIGDDDHPLEAGVLPRMHGSGLFTRGETQILTVLTLGSTREEQRLDGLDNELVKRYIHHYNFPPYSTGETGRMIGPKRREIGHGALAERALVPVIPGEQDFPYTIRMVSEALSSNGSTSMGSVCGSTIALLDAGVPIKAPVAGVAMGLISDKSGGQERVAILTDILGMEDALGDMDFKVAGSAAGITALQMDMKITGISFETLTQALNQAREGRIHILNKILAVIDKPRPELSAFAPRVLSLRVETDKIGAIIGPGGKTIRSIQDAAGATISIEDDGMIYIHAKDLEAGEACKKMIEMLVHDPEVGDVFVGKVVRTVPFGAFVQLAPGKDGLVHISKLSDGYVANVEDIVREGDMIEVEIAEVDRMGRINLVVRDLNPNGNGHSEN